jgi:hypothetical protein
LLDYAVKRDEPLQQIGEADTRGPTQQPQYLIDSPVWIERKHPASSDTASHRLANLFAVPACPFANGPAAISSFAPAYAGESGPRDNIRGAGYFGIDPDLAKRWILPWREKQSLQFRWEVFNVTNSVSFDVQSSLLSNSLGPGSGGSFGNYSGLLNNPRIMQFALRYEF